MFKRSALTFSRGSFKLKQKNLANPKQQIIAKSLTSEILDHNMITTTGAKAKFIDRHFYKFVDKVIKYNDAGENTELKTKYLEEAKSLLIGDIRSDHQKQQLFAKALKLADKWKRRIADGSIETVSFLTLSKLEHAHHDAHPVTFIELKDTPLFKDGTELPEYGNLSLWMAFESLLQNDSAPVISMKPAFFAFRNYLQHATKEEQDLFFTKDIMNARRAIQQRIFDNEQAALKAAIRKTASEDKDAEDEEDSPVFAFDESKYEALNQEIKTKYYEYIAKKEKFVASKPKIDIGDLGKINLGSRQGEINIIKNAEY